MGYLIAYFIFILQISFMAYHFSAFLPLPPCCGFLFLFGCFYDLPCIGLYRPNLLVSIFSSVSTIQTHYWCHLVILFRFRATRILPTTVMCSTSILLRYGQFSAALQTATGKVVSSIVVFNLSLFSLFFAFCSYITQWVTTRACIKKHVWVSP